uniref:Uncharacterized protein n=1 Tax=Rhizophora mucronata TaxID=61149 RepID=A0A2P2Q9R6_RHIMU
MFEVLTVSGGKKKKLEIPVTSCLSKFSPWSMVIQSSLNHHLALFTKFE